MGDGAYERLGAALEAATDYRPARDGGAWRCPAHEDGTPSLSLRRADGRVLVHCHAGCSVNAITEALGLGLRDLYDNPAAGNGSQPRPRIVATYDYLDESGALLYQVVRLEPEGVPPAPPGRQRWMGVVAARHPPGPLPAVRAAPGRRRRQDGVRGRGREGR